MAGVLITTLFKKNKRTGSQMPTECCLAILTCQNIYLSMFAIQLSEVILQRAVAFYSVLCLFSDCRQEILQEFICELEKSRGLSYQRMAGS